MDSANLDVTELHPGPSWTCDGCAASVEGKAVMVGGQQYCCDHCADEQALYVAGRVLDRRILKRRESPELALLAGPFVGVEVTRAHLDRVIERLGEVLR